MMISDGLSAHDLCKIIGICGKNGVKEFRHGDVLISFAMHAGMPTSRAEREATVLPEQLLDEISPTEELAAKEDRLSQMLIEDPVGYERMIHEEEMEVKGA